MGGTRVYFIETKKCLAVMIRDFHESSISEERQMLGIEPEERLMMNMLMRLWACGAD